MGIEIDTVFQASHGLVQLSDSVDRCIVRCLQLLFHNKINKNVSQEQVSIIIIEVTFCVVV